MTTQEMFTLVIGNATTEELLKFNKDVCAEIRARQSEAAQAAVVQFSRNDTVEFTTRGGITVRGIVEKINQKTVSVRETERKDKWSREFSPSAGRWKVAPTLLTKIKK